MLLPASASLDSPEALSTLKMFCTTLFLTTSFHNKGELRWPYAYGINLSDCMCPHQDAAFLMDRWKDGALCYRMQSPICGASLLWSKYTDLEIKELGVAPFKTRTLDNPLSDFLLFSAEL